MPVKRLAHLGHLGFEGDAVVFQRRRAHITPRRKHIVVLAHVFERRGFAVAGLVFVVAVLLFTPPRVVGFGEGRDVVGVEVLLRAADHGADLAGIDEEGLAFAVAVAAFAVGLFVFGQKPEADGDRGGVEELAGQGDHAVDEVVLDHLLADRAFALGVGRHGAVGEDEASHAVLGEFAHHVENPGVVGIAGGRGVVAVPASVVDELVGGPPVAQVEGRIGHDVVGLEVGVLILEEGIGGDFAEVGRESAHGEVHLGQLVGGGGELLPVNRDVLGVAVVAFDKLERLHEHAARAATGVVDLALVGLDHFGDEIDDALRGVELAPQLALGGGEFAEEVFIDPADGVLLLVADGVDVVDGIDEGGELAAIQPEAGEVVVRQGALERGIALLHRGEGGVDLDRDVALLGMLLDVGPAGGLRQVEDILHGVELHHVEVFLLALCHQLGPALLEFVGDELEEDQREHDVLVFRGLDGAPQLGGGVPEGFLEGFVWLFRCFLFCHSLLHSSEVFLIKSTRLLKKLLVDLLQVQYFFFATTDVISDHQSRKLCAIDKDYSHA